ncbi:MAG: SH3 domain-containing protein [Segetibacter sp.]|nr:SH3 domain-containing protein [Segetibacter sp.]
MKTLVGIFLVLLVSITSAMGQKISLEEVQTNIGQTVTVCGKIYGGRFISNAVNTPTLLNMGPGSPNHPLTLVIFGENLKDFPAQPELHYANKQVCVTGTIVNYKGQPEMILKSPDQIKMDLPTTTSSATIIKDSANKTTGIANNSTSNKPGINSGTASNKPVVTANKSSNSPVATPNKAPNSVVTGTNFTAKSSGTPNNPPIASASASQYDIKLTQDVYMRSGPTFDYPLVSTVKAGTVVTILSSSNGWSQVIIKDKDSALQGYIKNSVLK